jgi:WD40 repeat protein
MSPIQELSQDDIRKKWRYAVRTDFKSIADTTIEPKKRIIDFETAERFLPFDEAIRSSYNYANSTNSDDKLLAVINGSNIDVYDLETGSITVLEGHTSTIGEIGFSPTDPNLLVSSADSWDAPGEPNEIIIWNVAEMRDQIRAEKPVDIDRAAEKGLQAIISDLGDSLELSKDDIIEMTTALKSTIKRVRTRGRVPASSRLDGRISTSFQSPLFSNSGEYLIYQPGSRPESNGDDTWDFNLYHLGTRNITTLSGHRDSIMWTGFSPDDTLVASAGWDGSFRVHRVTGEEVWRWETGHQNWAAIWSPDGEYLAGTDGIGLLRIWNVKTGEETCKVQNGRSWCRAIDWSPDGKYLVVGSEDQGRITVYKVDNGKITLSQERKLNADYPDDEYGLLASMLSVDTAKFLPSSSGMKLLHSTAGDVGIEVFDFETGRGWRFVPSCEEQGEDVQESIVGYTWRRDSREIGILAPDGVRFWRLD